MPKSASRGSSPRWTRKDVGARTRAIAVSAMNAPAERASVRRSEDNPDESATFDTGPLIPNSVAAIATMA